MIRQKKKICWDKAKKAGQLKQNIQHREINQNVQVKEGKLKRYRVKTKQCRQSRTFQKTGADSPANGWKGGKMTLE